MVIMNSFTLIVFCVTQKHIDLICKIRGVASIYAGTQLRTTWDFIYLKKNHI